MGAVLKVVAVGMGLMLVLPGRAGAPRDDDVLQPPRAVVAADVFGGDVRPLSERQAELGGPYTVAGPDGTSVVAGGGVLSVRDVPTDGEAAWSLPQVRVGPVRMRYMVRWSGAGVDHGAVLTTQVPTAAVQVQLAMAPGGSLSWRALGPGAAPLGGQASEERRATPDRWQVVEVEVVEVTDRGVTGQGAAALTVRARTWDLDSKRPGWTLVQAAPAGTGESATGAVGVRVRAAAGPLSRVDFADLQVVDLDARLGHGREANLPLLAPRIDEGFVHPGVVNGSTSLLLARGAALAGREPWASALTGLRASRFADPAWTPRPVAVVACGANSIPDQGCSAETDDAQAAYTQALLWYFTGDREHARAATRILDAWSSVLVRHEFDTGTWVNGRLQSAWAALTFARAAELLRYSESGWSATGVRRFEDLLRDVFAPEVREGWTGGGANGQIAMASATMAIGVFVQDWGLFDDGVSAWRDQVRAAIYLTSDGPLPLAPAGTVIADDGRASRLIEYWHGVPAFPEGLEQETCRDVGHMALGFAAAFQGAETAALQGVDLYGLEQRRLVAGMEFNTRFLVDPGASGWPCREPLTWGGDFWRLTWAPAHRHYTASGVDLPWTAELLRRSRPGGTALFVNWETLTHGTAD